MVAARFRLLALGAPLAVAALGGSALATVCHPDARGTRTLALRGAVRSAALDGRQVDFVVAGRAGCTRIAWSIASGRSVRRTAACGSPVRAVASARVAPRVDSRGRTALALADGRLLPLPARPKPGSLKLAGGIAVYSAVHGQGVFAVRTSDGAYTFLGPDGGAFPALVGARGVVFHDGEMKPALRAGTTIVKFVPRAAIEQRFAVTTAPIETRGPIRAISFDGPRVAIAVADPRGVCDSVLYWNVAWPPVQRISGPASLTCVRGAATAIPALAIGGFRTEWVAGDRLIAGSPRCQQWIVRRLAQGPARERVTALAGDGSTLAYATTVRGLTSVGVVTGAWRARQIAAGAGAPLLAASRGRVAVLWPDGTLELRGVGGRLGARVAVGPARSLALDGSTLAVLRRGRLDVYDARTGSRTERLRVPAGATSVDLRYGVAALADGRSAVAVDTRSGRSAVVGSGSARLVGVQVDDLGLAYAWGRTARFVPWTRIDTMLG